MFGANPLIRIHDFVFDWQPFKNKILIFLNIFTGMWWHGSYIMYKHIHSEFFVMRLDLATGTKPMFEEEPSRAKRVIMYGSDEFGRLLVNKLVEPSRKMNKYGVTLYMKPCVHTSQTSV